MGYWIFKIDRVTGRYLDESSVNEIEIDLATDKRQPRNVAVSGGDFKEESNDNIDLAPEISEQAESTKNTNSEKSAQDNTTPALRRSERVRKQSGEWWEAPPSLLLQAFFVQEAPTSYKVATTPENISFWQPGIEREQDCLTRNHTWDLINYIPGMKVLPCKYVFKVKDSKPKVRLVALGCRQMYGVDYNEKYAPVFTLSTVRTILAIVPHLNLKLEQIDVITAFLNGDLNGDIFMHVPEGLKSPATSRKFCKLLK